MAKDDWYFLIGIIIGIIGLLGIDWNLVRGRVSTSSHNRQRILLFSIVGSVIMCAVGWYHSSNLTYSSDMTKLKSITGHTYINQVVPLDGFDYKNCTFT